MSEPSVSRRTLLAASALLPAAAVAQATSVRAADALPIRPRADWAGRLSPRGLLTVEKAGDVKFLLVHHTASSNAYRNPDVPERLRAMYRYHTGAKGWPDIAYNFLVDRFGTVWEGRMGSLTAPVKGSATGGSQGYAQLACFLGDCSVRPPTSAATGAMLRLLAQLADRYAIDTSPGSRAAFTSRGSNRWPVGQRVMTPTIAGHRDMSLTSCPGDGVYFAVRQIYPAKVTALRISGDRRGRASASTTSRPATPRSPQPSPRGAEPAASGSVSGNAPSRNVASKDSPSVEMDQIGIGGALLTLGAGAVIALRRRRRGSAAR